MPCSLSLTHDKSTGSKKTQAKTKMKRKAQNATNQKCNFIQAEAYQSINQSIIVLMCVCRIYIKGYLLTYLLTY